MISNNIVNRLKGVKSMNLTCSRCGNFKRTQEGEFCNECESKNRKDVRTIQDYLIEHPKASLADVSLDTGIPIRVLNVLVQERLIEFTPVGD